MRPVSATISIDAPRERVFDLLNDLSARPSFTDHFLTDYRLGRVDPVGPGAAARFRLRESGVWLDTVIDDDSERPHLLREHGYGGRSNRVPTFTVWELAEGPGDGSEVTVAFWTEPRNPVDKARELIGPSRYFRRDWRTALARLRELAEGERSVEHVAIAGADRVPSFNP
jgi:uncharacterized protein YndB with AHSA1/START domain